MPERKIYKLSDGTEAKSIDAAAREQLHGASLTWVVHPSLGPIAIGDDKLSPATAPLPAEPANGYVGRAGARLWERHDMVIENDSHPEERWWRTGVDKVYSWPEAVECMFGVPLVELVPDPAVGAPPLPWRKPSYDDRYPDLVVERARDDGGVLEFNGVGLAANQIRDLMGICARMLKPGAERDRLQAEAWVADQAESAALRAVRHEGEG